MMLLMLSPPAIARETKRSSTFDTVRLRGSMSSLALRRACRSLSTQHVRGFTGASASKIPVVGARGLAGSSKITRIQESFFEPVRTHYPTIQQLAQLTLTAVSRICR
jgi:hypothetical protein